MFDDDAARRALGTLADEPAPPVATSLDQVLRRGRRRVFAQRAGAVAGVMAVVAAIGVSAVLLRPGDQQNGVHIADSTTPAPPGSTSVAPPSSTMAGPRNPVPPTTLPGWEQMEFPARTQNCQQPFSPLPPEPQIDILPQDVVQPAFLTAVDEASPVGPRVTLTEWQADDPKLSGPRGYIAAELPMAGGNGQVRLEAGRYGGTPEQVADASLTTYGNCAPPQRRLLPDGTIMQLYPAHGEDTASPTRPLQIYRPDNRIYIVTAAGWGEADMTPEGGLSGGRGALPLSDAQLAEVATELVAKLG